MGSEDKDTSSVVGSDAPKRETWGKSVEFVLSCIGYSVGLGNIWRWPYLCYENGGGAFLIPYWFMVIAIGLPMFYLELVFGQFASLGVTKIWKIAPFWKGIGFAMCIVSALNCIYYNLIVAYTIYFLFKSFAAKLPWADCKNSWNSDMCLPSSANITEFYNPDLFNGYPLCDASKGITIACTPQSVLRSSTLEFWENHVLGLSDGLDNFGTPQLHLVIALFVAWILVAGCLVKGIQSTGKVVYFTATFPYLVLTILLVRGVTLPGATDGLKFLFTPTWSRLAEAKVWSSAASQVFYSLGSGFGGLLTMASYNKFNNNSQRDAVIVGLMDTFTSFYGGLVIFSILGFMAHERGVAVNQVASSGSGLAFIAYPEAVARMPQVPPLWSCLFFFMLMVLGIDSMFTTLETIITAFMDEMPRFRKWKLHMTIGLCVVLFLLGLPMTCNGGQYLLTLLNEYAAGLSLLFISLFEVIVICWVYGFRRFFRDIKSMLGAEPNYYWRICWMGLTPITILFVIIFSCVQYEAPTYGKYNYTTGGIALGWLSLMASVICIPIYMIFRFCRSYDGNILKTLKRINTSTDDWGPALEEDKEKRRRLDVPDDDPEDVSEDNSTNSSGSSPSNVSDRSSIIVPEKEQIEAITDTVYDDSIARSNPAVNYALRLKSLESTF